MGTGGTHLEICDGAGAGISDGAPLTCSGNFCHMYIKKPSLGGLDFIVCIYPEVSFFLAR